MLNKKTIKIIAIAVVVIMGTIAFMYAQDKFNTSKTENGEAVAQESEDSIAEDIGEKTGDDPIVEIEKLVGAYYSASGSRFSGEIRLTDASGEKEKMIEKQNFEYEVTGGNDYYYAIGDVAVVNNKGLLLMVDKQQKIISVANEADGKKGKVQLFDIRKFKKMTEQSKADLYVTKSGETKMLTVENILDPQIQGYRIYYDPVSYEIKKVLIGMLRTNAVNPEDYASENTTGEQEVADVYTYYMEIQYKNKGILNVKGDAFRPEERFIKIKNDEIGLAAGYKDYELVLDQHFRLMEAEGEKKGQ